jgi:hypothetical protein
MQRLKDELSAKDYKVACLAEKAFVTLMKKS